MYFRYFSIISPCKKTGPFIWTKLNSLYTRLLCAKFSWNWLTGSGEEDCLNMSMYFRYLVSISFWKRARPFIWTNFNPQNPRILCAKFGAIGSVVLKQMTLWKVYRRTDRRTDDGQQAIRKAHLSSQVR